MGIEPGFVTEIDELLRLPTAVSPAAAVAPGSARLPLLPQLRSPARHACRRIRGHGDRPWLSAAEKRASNRRDRGALPALATLRAGARPGVLRRVRVAPAGGDRDGPGATPSLAAPDRLVSGRLDLGLGADARRRDRGRRGGDRVRRQFEPERRDDHGRPAAALGRHNDRAGSRPPPSRPLEPDHDHTDQLDARDDNTAAPPNGRTPWPAGRNGWTVVLFSYPSNGGTAAPNATATRAAQAGLPEVGVLDSSDFSSLHPGYYVVFSGIYSSLGEAETALRTAHATGFASAYTRQITR